MTFAKFLSADDRSLHPEWATVESHVRALASGQTKSLSLGLSETGSDTYFIACFVKPSGIYVSARGQADLDDFQLFDPNEPDELVNCVMGGRAGSVVGRGSIVDQESVMRAARTYFETGVREPTLNWRPSLEALQRLERGELVGSRY